MFKKLLSNLPFNPSLIGQVSFYAKRLHQEERLRQLGFVCVVLAMFVQMFAVISPPEPTLARSGNDIIDGGFTKQSTAVEHCQKNSQQLKTILAHFDISCANVASGSVKTIRSTDHDRKLLSLGRLPYGKTGERAVKIGNDTYYQRYLWSWDSGPYSSYKVISGSNEKGLRFYVLFNCGNVTVIERPPVTPPKTPKPPTPPPTAPKLELKKLARNSTQNVDNANGTTANPGDKIIYTLQVKNSGNGKAEKFVVEENMNDVLEYADIVDLHGGTKDKANIVRWPKVDIPAGSTLTKKITIKVKSPLPSTPTPVSNPGSFDLLMTNVYGNAINIKLPGSVVKITEQVVAQQLPNTGPGTSRAIAVGVTVFASYFFARTHLLAKEVAIVREEYTVSGGM